MSDKLVLNTYKDLLVNSERKVERLLEENMKLRKALENTLIYENFDQHTEKVLKELKND